MLVDYHIHTKMCGHAEGEGPDYIARARELGFLEIGIADHIPMYFLPHAQRDRTIAMAMEELPLYIDTVLKWREENPDIPVRLGIEADFIPGKENLLKEILKSNPFDYIIGSIHFIDDWGFDNPHFIEVYDRWDIDELYCKYFELVRSAAESNLFDILAHIDLVKKFGFRPKRDLTDILRKTVRVIKKADVCIELNTAGLRVPVGEIYPSRVLLELCYQEGVPVTLGSDAHSPYQVGYNFQAAANLLKKVGYRELAIFRDRKRSFIRL